MIRWMMATHRCTPALKSVNLLTPREAQIYNEAVLDKRHLVAQQGVK